VTLVDTATIVAAVAGVAAAVFAGVGVAVEFVVDKRQADRSAEAEKRAVDREAESRRLADARAAAAEEQADRRAQEARELALKRLHSEHDQAIDFLVAYARELAGRLDALRVQTTLTQINGAFWPPTGAVTNLFQEYHSRLAVIAVPGSFGPEQKVIVSELVAAAVPPVGQFIGTPDGWEALILSRRTILVEKANFLEATRLGL
jgi:hypothetical protein